MSNDDTEVWPPEDQGGTPWPPQDATQQFYTDDEGQFPLDEPDPRPVPVVDITKPVDWLEAADAIDPYFIDPVYDEDWAEFMRAQLGRTMWYLMERHQAIAAPDLATVARRAAVILNAEPGAPEAERMLGIRTATEYEGQQVKCRNSACRRKWTCLPEDPYYDAVSNQASGICASCMLTETRTDAAVPELGGMVVTKPRPRTRKAVAGSDQRDE